MLPTASDVTTDMNISFKSNSTLQRHEVAFLCITIATFNIIIVNIIKSNMYAGVYNVVLCLEFKRNSQLRVRWLLLLK